MSHDGRGRRTIDPDLVSLHVRSWVTEHHIHFHNHILLFLLFTRSFTSGSSWKTCTSERRNLLWKLMIHTGEQEERFLFVTLWLFGCFYSCSASNRFSLFVVYLKRSFTSLSAFTWIVMNQSNQRPISFPVCFSRQESSNQAHLWADGPPHPHVVCQPLFDQNHLGHGH